MMTAFDGNLVDISLFRAEPFPRLSVHVRITWILVRPSPGTSPKNSLRLIRTASASNVDMIKAGPFRSGELVT